jgi:hypothetical protein
MGCWIANGAKDTYEEVGDTFLLADLGFRTQGVEGKERLLAESAVLTNSEPTDLKTRHLPQSLADALDRLKHRVKIVLLKALSSAVFEDFHVHSSLLKRGVKALRSCTRLFYSCLGRSANDLTRSIFPTAPTRCSGLLARPVRPEGKRGRVFSLGNDQKFKILVG